MFFETQHTVFGRSQNIQRNNQNGLVENHKVQFERIVGGKTFVKTAKNEFDSKA